MAKDKETEEKKATKEEKKKVTKKAAKKTAKKKVTKKAAKKVAKKTVAKKTATKKTVTKKTTTRKKPAEKKPIKLKEDSKDLDSFAVHAAESADNNNIEVAKQPEQPAPAPEQSVSKPVSKPVTPASTKTEPVTTEPYLKRPPASAKTSADKGEGGLFRLIFVVLLFAGVAYYIDEIYDENQASAKKAPVAAKQVSEPDQAVTPASAASEVITELKPVEETVAQPELPPQIEQVEQQAAVEKKEPVPSPVTAPVVSQAEAASSALGSAVEPKQETLQAPELVPVPAPASALQPASTGFPPPPLPEFLTRPAPPQQVPEDQMQLIMQTFGPAAD